MKGNLIIGQGLSKEPNPEIAAREAMEKALKELEGAPISMGLVFLSPRYAQPVLLQELKKYMKDAPFLGCTTEGEILNGLQEHSLCVILLSSPYIEAEVCHVKYDPEDPKGYIQDLISQKVLQKAMGEDYHKEISRQGKRCFGILFTPGPTFHQNSALYEVFLTLKEALGENIPIVGASAGDYWEMKGSWALSSKGIFENSIGFMLVVTSLRFGIGMSHGFESTDRRAILTKVAGLTVLELNNQPAMEVVPWLFQIKPEDLTNSYIPFKSKKILGVPDRFGRYQLVVPRFITKEGGLLLSQPLYPNTQVEAMKLSTTIAHTARDAIARALIRAGVEFPSISFVFSCALPWRLTLDHEKIEEYQAIRAAYGDVKVAGFYSMGEYGISLEGINRACNGAVSALIFSENLWDAAEIYIENQQLISSLNQKQSELKEAYKEWKATFDHLPISIAIIDNNFTITRVNKTMADSLGKPEEEIVGKKCFNLVQQLDSPPPIAPLLTCMKMVCQNLKRCMSLD